MHQRATANMADRAPWEVLSLLSPERQQEFLRRLQEFVARRADKSLVCRQDEDDFVQGAIEWMLKLDSLRATGRGTRGAGGRLGIYEGVDGLPTLIGLACGR